MLKSTYYKYKNNELLKAVAVYTTLSFVIKGISFLITPFFTHYITPEEFGSLNLFLTSIIFLTPIISVPSNSIINNYFNETKEVFEKKTSTYLTFSFLITLLLTLITFAFSNYVTAFFTLPISIIVVLPLTTFLSFLFDVVLLLARNESNKKRVFTATIIKTILEISLSIYFIMNLNMAGIGRILAFCLSNFLLSIWAILILIKKYNVVIYLKLKYLKEEYKFWFSIIISFLFVIVFNVCDKYIVKAFYNKTDFGNYAFASQLGSILLTFTGAFQLAFQPKIINELKNLKSIKTVKRLFFLANITCFLFAIMMYFFFATLFKNFINEKYQNAWPFVKWTTLVYLFWAVLNNYLIIINYYKKVKLNYILGGTSILIIFPIQILFAYFGIYHMLIFQLFFLIIYIFILKRNLGLYGLNN